MVMIGSGAQAVILNFHGIGDPHDGVPDDEKPYWLDEDRFTQVVDMVAERRRAGGAIEVTFDDGNKSDLDIGARILAERDVPATFFVLTGRIGAEHYLTEGDIRTLLSMGMGIGLHGQDHVDWRSVSDDVFAVETITARKQLADVAGMEIAEVAIPFGAYDRKVIGRLKTQGYHAIYTSYGVRADLRNKVRSRTSLRSDTDDAALEAILENRYGAKSRMRRAASKFVRQYIK